MVEYIRLSVLELFFQKTVDMCESKLRVDSLFYQTNRVF